MQTSRELKVQTATIRAGLVGRGIGLSRTPAMHEAEGRALGIDYSYRPFDMDDAEMDGASLAQVIETAEAQGFCGLNVTYPYKIEAMQHVHTLSEDARAVGAVNTIVLRDGRRAGHNTDLWGFAEGFRAGMQGATLGRVLLLGAGGAGGAVAHALLALGVRHLWLFDTDDTRAAALTASLAARFGPGRAALADTPECVAFCLDGLVNATPVGMAKLPGTPFPVALIRPAMWVADIVYFPLQTELLAAARRAGCRILPGSGMAVYQAVRAFELFTGRRPDPERMRRTFESMGG